MWLDLQIQLIEAKWLQEHPDTWYKDAMHESESFINKQANGKPNDDLSQTHHIDVNKPKPIKKYSLEQDWSILENLIDRQRLHPLKSIFRMIGWTVFAATKWLDIKK